MYLLTSNLVGGPSHFALSRRLVALAFAARMRASVLRVCAYAVRIRQHPSAYVGMLQHTAVYVSIRQHTSAYVGMRQYKRLI
jgi:hypothetical protein